MKRISLWFLRSEGKGVGLEVEEVDSSRKYDVYGLVRSGQLGSSSQKYVGGLGHESDGSTGLIYMRARYMDPVLGRFLSEDPSKDGVNWFVYCGDEPVNLCDKDGKKPLPNSDWFFLGIIFATFAVFEACLGLTDIPDGGDFVYPVSFRWAVILGNCSVGFFARALVGLDIDPAIQAKLANVAITMGIFEGVTFFLQSVYKLKTYLPVITSLIGMAAYMFGTFLEPLAHWKLVVMLKSIANSLNAGKLLMRGSEGYDRV